MEEETINLQDYIDAIREKWWLLVLVPVLAGLVALGLGLRPSPAAPTAPMYDATTVVFMEGAEALAQFPELAKTTAVLEDAIGDLGLSMSVAQLRDKVAASPVGGTPMLRIKVQDSDPALAVTIADGVARSLVDHVSAAQQLRYAAVRDQLSTQLDELAAGDPAGSSEALTSALVPLALRPYIVSPAEVSEAPINETASPGVSSPILRNLFLGVFLGGIIAVIVVIGLEHFESPIRSPEKLELSSGPDRLGILPRWTKSEGLSHEAALAAGSDPVAAEAFKEVAATVASSSEAEATRVLAVISPDTGDGRSSLVANLGVALASAWRDVVLVDADLHRPSLHHYFGLENGMGLSNFLLDPGLTVADIVQATTYPGLRVITSGPGSYDLGSQLTSPRMDYLWEQLKEVAHLTLVDTPPVRAAADGLIIASQAQGVVLLVNGETCRREPVKGMLAKLGKARTPLLGYVWNRMSPSRFDRYSTSRRYFKGLNRKPPIHTRPASGTEAAGGQSHSNGAGAARATGSKLEGRV